MTALLSHIGQLPRLDVAIRKDWDVAADGEGARIGVLTLRQSDYGLWQFAWSEAARGGQELAAAQVSGEDIGRWGVVVRSPDTGQVLASGPVTTIITASGRVNGLASDSTSCWGVTDLTHLRERIVFPDPAVDIPAATSAADLHTWTTEGRTFTGTPEAIIRQVVRENLGDLALARRRLPGVTLNVPPLAGIGDQTSITITEPANRNVLDVVQSMCAIGGLVVDMINTSNGVLDFVIREPATRRSVVWDVDTGTAAGLFIKRQRRPKTDVIALGSGATNPEDNVYVRRTADQVGAGVTGGFAEVREEFIRGSGDVYEDLRVKADEEIDEDGPEIGLRIEPSAANPYRGGVDYLVGDVAIGVLRPRGAGTATVEVEAPISELLLRHDEGTLVEEPSSDQDQDDETLAPVLEGLERRIRRLEDLRP